MITLGQYIDKMTDISYSVTYKKNNKIYTEVFKCKPRKSLLRNKKNICSVSVKLGYVIYTQQLNLQEFPFEVAFSEAMFEIYIRVKNSCQVVSSLEDSL